MAANLCGERVCSEYSEMIKNTVYLYSSCDTVPSLINQIGITVMAHSNLTADSRFSLEKSPSSFSVRLGRREIFVCRDTYVRRYRVNPIAEFNAGIQPGHLEIVLFRRWLVVLSKARY
jgi:hypothetical protein